MVNMLNISVGFNLIENTLTPVTYSGIKKPRSSRFLVRGQLSDLRPQITSFPLPHHSNSPYVIALNHYGPALPG
jgi:hypothetical protein